MVNALDFLDSESYFEAVREQEEDQYNGSSYTNELQQVFEQSRRKADLRSDTERIKALTAQGKFVLFSECEICCPSTDALIGVINRVVSVHDTEEAAWEAAGEDTQGYGVASPYIPKEVIFGSEEANNESFDEIPF
jgi:hypothetical protein